MNAKIASKPSINGRCASSVGVGGTVGTGGHTNYVKIWKGPHQSQRKHGAGISVIWHTITFDESFTLYANETYNYTIRTGSYPQIIHESSWNATGGVITCTSFVNVNGKRHENWIPAIRPS